MKKLLTHTVWLLLLVPGTALAQLSPGYSPDLTTLPSASTYESSSKTWRPVLNTTPLQNLQLQQTGTNIPRSGPFCNNGVCSYTPLEPFNWYDARPGSYGSLAQYLNAAFRVLLTLGSMFAVVMLVFAGITYMISESGIKISAAKDRIKSALIGLVLLVGAWLVVAAINPNLLNLSTLMDAFPARTAPVGTNPNQNTSTVGQQTMSWPVTISPTDPNKGNLMQAAARQCSKQFVCNRGTPDAYGRSADVCTCQ